MNAHQSSRLITIRNKGPIEVFQRLLQLFMVLALSLSVVGCANEPICRDICTTKTMAPKNACSRPYTIKGIKYYPQAHFEYEECGLASYYGGGDVFHGRKTATGEVFDKNEVSAAHKTLPLPCVVHVTNLENGREIQVKVNDRGPFVDGRIIDLSRRTAQLLGFEGKGLAKVRVRTLVPETLVLRGMDPSTVMVQQTKSKPKTNPHQVMLATKLPEDLFDQAIAEDMSEDQIANLIGIQPERIASRRPSASQKRGIFVLVQECINKHEAHEVLRKLVGKVHAPVEAVEASAQAPIAVRVGPFLNMADANLTLDQLSNAGHVKSRIIIQR